ncbi:thiamine diphosphokinase [Citreicella sp. C3M06]|uniref:thiamine diphosphokinase n=1 Tax=Citreicella sp. C3M06 TaxID=2841564 RepID=UPI001C0820EE|nr:thiamine diphosphokinase [Citreicella sp. C3M06]MBU2962960.1 thiamine diphosphokinase [Citreicella sp. C3M06]
MNHPVLCSENPILLVGGGQSAPSALDCLASECALRVAADGGVDRLLARGVMPDAVIGDLDSISDQARAAVPAERIHHIPEQDSTDFDKCLRNIDAPLVWGMGFLGGRIDHELAALTVLAGRADRRCILLGPEDCIALLPPSLTLDLKEGVRLSLYPLGEARGRSTGLRWPIDGITMSPGTRVGTSNESCAARVTLEMDAPLMLIILPLEWRQALAQALQDAPGGWPARAGR